MSDPDNLVRLHIYEQWVADGRPPSAAETATALGLAEAEVEEASGGSRTLT